MTKFEEELFNKVPCKFELTTEAEYKKTTLINHFKNWRSDEEFQELKEQYGNQADSILSMLDEIKSLKSQLQQQALPVVPECVAKWYEEHKDDLESSIYRLCIEFNQKVVNTLKTKTKLENWFDYTENKPIETLIRMQDGYQVEKPQLFYLRDELTGQFLAKDNQFKDKDRYFFWAGADPLTHSIGTAWKLTFTQQEIESMETGSYEQIEVAE